MTPPRILVVECSPTDPAARLGEWLSAAGAELHVRSAEDAPTDTDGWDGLVVMGGPMGANDDATVAWLPGLKQLLRAAVGDELPTLGVCLGAQVLAVANGGRVQPMPDGPQIGAQLVAKRAAAATDPLFARLPITPDVIQWHFDTVVDLPRGAVHLAASPPCEHEAFRVGRLAWGLQFHIETTPDMIRDWAAGHARKHPAESAVADLDIVVQRAIAVHDDLAEVWAPFAGVFVDVARNPLAVAPPPSVQVTTAAPVTDPAAIRAALAAEANSARATLPMPGLRDRNG